MRMLMIKPKKGLRLKAAMDRKRNELRIRGGTFALDRRGNWVHARYKGWVSVKKGSAGVILAQTRTRVPEEEWRILTAFIGFLDRHFYRQIASIAIAYR